MGVYMGTAGSFVFLSRKTLAPLGEECEPLVIVGSTREGEEAKKGQQNIRR